MAITVEQARQKLENAVLHTEVGSFSYKKLDHALIAACNRFLRETHVVRSSETLALSSGTEEYDLDTAISAQFRPDQILGVMYLAADDYSPVQVVAWDVIRREYDTSDASGRPEMIAFNGDKAIVYPSPDTSYNVTMQTWDLLDQTNWTIGGMDATTRAVELNIPDRWVDDVIWFGARAYLLLGAPGHPDAYAAMQEFLRNVIPLAKGEGTRHGAWWPSYKGTLEQGYGPRPRL